jgi:hypothetical protein
MTDTRLEPSGARKRPMALVPSCATYGRPREAHREPAIFIKPEPERPSGGLRTISGTYDAKRFQSFFSEIVAENANNIVELNGIEPSAS